MNERMRPSQMEQEIVKGLREDFMAIKDGICCSGASIEVAEFVAINSVVLEIFDRREELGDTLDSVRSSVAQFLHEEDPEGLKSWFDGYKRDLEDGLELESGIGEMLKIVEKLNLYETSTPRVDIYQ